MYVAVWIGLSGCVIMYNKYLLAYRGFPYPITLTMWCVPSSLAGGLVTELNGLVCQLRSKCGPGGTGSCTCPAYYSPAQHHSIHPPTPPTTAPPRRHMFFCAALAIGLVKSGKVQAISMDRETYIK